MTVRHELKAAIRVIWTNPGYVFVATVLLTVGIGINAMIFSVVNATVLHPMPLVHSAQLVQLRDVQFADRSEGGASYADMRSWQERSHSLQDVAAYYDRDVVMLASGRTAERLNGEVTTVSLFPLIGVVPIHGRLFLPQEGTAGGDKVVLLSYQLWTSRFRADPAAVGSRVTIDGESFTIVGVMPARFGFPDNQTLWLPMVVASSQSDRKSRYLRVVGRLREGVTLASAQKDLGTVAKLLANEFPESNEGHGVRVIAFDEAMAGQMRPVLLLMLGAVGFVLLIVCANVGSLALARASARQIDLAVRIALGATRGQVARLLLGESVVIGLLGGAGGIGFAYVGLRLVKAMIPFDPPLWVVFDIDPAVMLYTFTIAVGTGLIFGMVPVLKLSEHVLATLIRGGGRGIAADSGTGRIRSVLLVGQLTVSTVLLICALLLVRSFLRTQAVGPGFDPRHILTAEVATNGGRYEVSAERDQFFDRLRQGAADLPAVTGVAVVTQLPIGSNGFSALVSAETAPEFGNRPRPVGYRGISAEYFDVLGVPLEEGRGMTKAEERSAAPVVIASRQLVKNLWPGEDPIGRRIRMNDRWRTVIGVTPDAPMSKLGGVMQPQMYVPLPSSTPGSNTPAQVILVVATRDPATTSSALYGLVAAMDPGVPLSDVKEMRQVLSEAFWQQRLFGDLFGAFALFAMLIAVVGIYGSISYGVSLRHRELAVRRALGATPGGVIFLVTRRGATLAVMGIGLGIFVAMALTRILASQLYDVSATDLPTFAISVCVLTTASAVASYIPARRATRIALLSALGST